MVARSVELRLRETGFDEVKAGLEEISVKLDEIKAKFDELGNKLVTPEMKVAGIDESIAKVDELTAKLDKLGSKHVEAKVDVKIGSSDLDKLKKAAGGAGSLASLLGGGGDGSSGAAGAAGAAGQSGSGLAAIPWVGALTAAGVIYAMSMLPALVPATLGLGIGGLGAFGAYKIGSSDETQLLALQQSLARASTKKQQEQIRAQIAAFESQNSAGLGIFGAFHNISKSLSGAFMGALTSDVTGLRRTGHGVGSEGQAPIPGTSFLDGIVYLLKQFNGFIKQIGPGLADMFRASLPFLQMYEQVFEYLVKLLMPIFTQVMRELEPYLPNIKAGFEALAQAIGYFIKDLGPGMKYGAEIFQATCIAIKGIMIALAYVCDALAFAFVKISEFSQRAADDIRNVWDHARRWIGTTFDAIRGTIHEYWGATCNFLVGSFRGALEDLEHWWDNLYQYIVGSFQKFGSLLYNFGKAVIDGLWHGMVDAVKGLISWVESLGHWISNAFGSVLKIFSPSKVFYEHGQNIIRGLVQGLNDGLGTVHAAMNRVANATSFNTGRPGAFGSGSVAAAGAGSAGTVRVELEFVGTDAFTTFLKKNIRTRGGNANVVGR